MDDQELIRAFARRRAVQALVPLSGLVVAVSMVVVFSRGGDGSVVELVLWGVGPAMVWGPFALALTAWNFRCPACGHRLPAVDLEGGMAAWMPEARCPSCGRRLS